MSSTDFPWAATTRVPEPGEEPYRAKAMEGNVCLARRTAWPLIPRGRPSLGHLGLVRFRPRSCLGSWAQPRGLPGAIREQPLPRVILHPRGAGCDFGVGTTRGHIPGERPTVPCETRGGGRQVRDALPGLPLVSASPRAQPRAGDHALQTGERGRGAHKAAVMAEDSKGPRAGVK